MLAIWAGLIVVGQLASLPEWPVLKVALATINLEFMAGIVAAQVVLSGRHVTATGPVLLSVSCICAFVLSGAARDDSWLVGFAIALLLPWLCQMERDGRFNVPSWLVFGGAASYAIYLTHNPLLSIASRMSSQVGLDWPAAILAGVGVSTLVGVMYHLGWEKPVMRQVRHVARRPVRANLR